MKPTVTLSRRLFDLCQAIAVAYEVPLQDLIEENLLTTIAGEEAFHPNEQELPEGAGVGAPATSLIHLAVVYERADMCCRGELSEARMGRVEFSEFSVFHRELAAGSLPTPEAALLALIGRDTRGADCYQVNTRQRV